MKKRTDIPYAQRLIQKKADEIMAHRKEASTLALCVMMCTLAEEYGFGYNRLCKLASATMENINDVYASDDPEYECDRVRRRLRQLGFAVSQEGKIYGVVDENGNPVPAKITQTGGNNEQRASEEKHP